MSSPRFAATLRMVLARARDEAARLGHAYVGTEHLLLALVETDGSMLDALHVDLTTVRRGVEATLRIGRDAAAETPLPYTARAKLVLEYAIEEARALGRPTVHIGDLLIALVREERGAAAQVLAGLGVTVERARQAARAGD